MLKRGSSEILSYRFQVEQMTLGQKKPLRQVQNKAANSLLYRFSLQNTTESELVCRASKVLRIFYLKHGKTPCLKKNSSVLMELQRLFRAFRCLDSSVSGAGQKLASDLAQ